MKKVLVITYSQSGQLDEIVSNVLKPMQGQVEIHYEKLKPKPSFPFPWTDLNFWDVMPECVEMIPADIEPIKVDTEIKYDLVILGYPIWFLSPPIPITTFLKSKTAKRLLSEKPVVTVIGSRNMWISAQENVKQLIAGAGGNLVGNIALRDRHHNLPRVVTIVYWMMTGKKDRFLGIFPKPGVSDEDIKEAEKFGPPILKALRNNSLAILQDDLIALNAIEIIPSVVSIEKKGKRIFKIWSKFILKKGGPGNPARNSRLKMFKWYLLFVIFAVSPIATLIFYMTYPFFFLKINREMDYYNGVKLK
jgi:hypothetical protein